MTLYEKAWKLDAYFLCSFLVYLHSPRFFLYELGFRMRDALYLAFCYLRMDKFFPVRSSSVSCFFLSPPPSPPSFFIPSHFLPCPLLPTPPLSFHLPPAGSPLLSHPLCHKMKVFVICSLINNWPQVNSRRQLFFN